MTHTERITAELIDFAGREPGAPLSVITTADGVRDYTLPRDHGPHFDYQTEWWYYTGNLSAGDGRHFGFQLTFFRRGLAPGSPGHGVGLRTHQIYLAHLAVNKGDLFALHPVVE